MSMHPDPDELREEYDFTPEDLRRGGYAARYARDTSFTPLQPDVVEALPDAEAVDFVTRVLAVFTPDRYPVQRIEWTRGLWWLQDGLSCAI